MRLSLPPVIIMAGLLIAPVSHEAAATPVATVAAGITPAVAGGSIAKIYYYQGHYYPYHYHGGYYSYRYGGQYYRHRYYRHSRWYYY